MTATIDHAAVAADLLATMANNIRNTERALEIAKMQRAPGFVFVWPEYWLAAVVKGNTCRAGGVAQGTITHKADKRVFTNGKGEQAVLMNIIEALEGALAHGLKVQADMIKAVEASNVRLTTSFSDAMAGSAFSGVIKS